jgi:hypothetical protein
MPGHVDTQPKGRTYSSIQTSRRRFVVSHIADDPSRADATRATQQHIRYDDGRLRAFFPLGFGTYVVVLEGSANS